MGKPFKLSWFHRILIFLFLPKKDQEDIKKRIDNINQAEAVDNMVKTTDSLRAINAATLANGRKAKESVIVPVVKGEPVYKPVTPNAMEFYMMSQLMSGKNHKPIDPLTMMLMSMGDKSSSSLMMKMLLLRQRDEEQPNPPPVPVEKPTGEFITE